MTSGALGFWFYKCVLAPITRQISERFAKYTLFKFILNRYTHVYIVLIELARSIQIGCMDSASGHSTADRFQPEEVGSDHVYVNKCMMSRRANSIPLR